MDDDVANGRSDLVSEAVDGPDPPELLGSTFFSLARQQIYNDKAPRAFSYFFKSSNQLLALWALFQKRGS